MSTPATGATEPRFLQIHTLTAYPASLLNRDDVGFAKRIPFGGASRVRISSQCLKRHWRTADDEWALSGIRDLSVRSRITFEEKIAKPLIADGLDAEKTRTVLAHIEAALLGESDKAKAAKKKGSGKGKAVEGDVEAPEERIEDLLRTKQVIILGRPEIEYIAQITKDLVGVIGRTEEAEAAVKRWHDAEAKRNFQALYKSAAGAAGLDAALFGRMVTSDVLARGDAAVHVAHAFTVHAEETENDYFSAVDDLLAEAGEHGSGHIGEAELTSGLYYGYVVVDVPLLVSNLTGMPQADWMKADRADAARVVEHLIHLIATVSPGAKKGSTAPYACAELMLVEAGRRQPRTLANAFLDPVSKRVDGGVLGGAVQALGGKLAAFDRMYGKREARRLAAMVDVGDVPVDGAEPLDELAAWARSAVEAGRIEP